ncbi:hypothetical protein [Hahella ganghwensis]|uniref:hypothetical protein n=1 Tax=Hahella ganghwensis TaxID=286420 RepID=UPI00036E6F58|nr:hypothetical protein [Hahella ganghwensis]
MIKVLFVAAAVASGVAQGGTIDSKNFDECVLEHMKGVVSDVAARSINRACRNQFPDSVPSEEISRIPKLAVDKIAGEGKVGVNGAFSGELFNGNREWVVHQVIVRLIDKNSATYRDYKADVKDGAKGEGNLYVESGVQPLSKGSFTFEVFSPPGQYDWYLLEGYGVKLPE